MDFTAKGPIEIHTPRHFTGPVIVHRTDAKVGDYSFLVVGAHRTGTAGFNGRVIAGHDGVAEVGPHGTAIVLANGRAKAGRNGIVAIEYFDYAAERFRYAIGYVGEKGILPDVLYSVQDGRLVPASV